jgi:S-adenosylhomocysteine hydrolase
VVSSQGQAPPTLFGYRLGNAVPTLDEMPLLRTFVEGRKFSQPLKGVTALLIQHQLGNQGPQVQALVELGLDPKKIHWLDIPYTSSELFRRTMQDRHGIPERNFWVHRCGVLQPYASYQFIRTHDAFLRFLRRPPEQLLVLDDGAYFLDAAMSFQKQLPHIAVVEQTTRGITNIKENAALARFARNYPVINVARSAPKLELESPWIGTSVLLSLTRHLRDLQSRSPQFAVKPDSPCLVLGYGAVGRQVAGHLQGFAKVYVSDSKQSQIDLARRDGFAVWDRQSQIDDPNPIEFKLVVGCTGRASFAVGDHGFLDRHAVLVSASSGAVELSRSAFIDLASASPHDDLRLKTSRLVPHRVHQNIRMQLRDRSIVFLNGGFPINFDGRLNSIPAKYMQPTAMLMVYGAIQALTTLQRGIVEVDAGFSKKLNEDFRASLNGTELAALEYCSRDLVA